VVAVAGKEDIVTDEVAPLECKQGVPLKDSFGFVHAIGGIYNFIFQGMPDCRKTG
jgi:hypothetical protein